MRKASISGRDAHFREVAFVVEEDVAADPVDVEIFGANGVMFKAGGIADAVDEFGGLGGGHGIGDWEFGIGEWRRAEGRGRMTEGEWRRAR